MTARKTREIICLGPAGGWFDQGDLPVSGGERPHLALVTDLGSLRDLPGSGPTLLDPAGEPVVGKLAHPRGPRETELAEFRGVGEARLRLLYHADRDRREGRRAARGRRRTFDWRQRWALAKRDGGCAFPDGDRPPNWTDGHHLTPWWEGGGTDLENGALLCKAHHTMVHQLGWTLPKPAASLLRRPEAEPERVARSPKLL